MSASGMAERDFLEDYLQFGLWQPAYFSNWLLRQMDKSGPANKSFALQIYLNFQMALEALSMWYFALSEWSPGASSLTKKFDGIQIRESRDAPYSTQRALTDLDSMELPDLLRKLKVPTEQELRDRGWGRKEIRKRSEEVSKIPDLLRRAMQNRMAASGDLVRAFNKFKHGLLVLQSVPGAQGQQDAVALVTQVDLAAATDLGTKTIWLACSPEKLKPLVDATISVCQLVAMLLVLVPWYHMSDVSWRKYRSSPNAVDGVACVFQRLEGLRA